jgi:hypothetical protein
MTNFLSYPSSDAIVLSGSEEHFSVSNETELICSFRYRVIHCLQKRGRTFYTFTHYLQPISLFYLLH